MKQENSMSLHEVGDYFGCSWQTVRNRLTSEWKGKLKYIPGGRTARSWRIDRVEFRRFIKELQESTQETKEVKCRSTTATVSGTYNSISVDDALSARLGVEVHGKRLRN